MVAFWLYIKLLISVVALHQAWHPRTRPLQARSNSAPMSAQRGPQVPGWLLHTSLRHCQPTTSALCQFTSPDSTTSPAQYFWSSDLLYHRSDGLEFTTRQSPWPSAQQRSFQTTVEDQSYFGVTTEYTQRSRDASWLCMIDIDIRSFSTGMMGDNSVWISLHEWVHLAQEEL